MNITFIQAGGTIDKDYPHQEKGWAFEIGDPAVKDILSLLNPTFSFNIISAMKKDSLEIKEKDRQSLADLIRKSKSDKIIITHGTDTMKETAQYIASQINDKIIVLTGSMKPAIFKDTDAHINIGMAIAGVQIFSAGTYIAMHGIIKPWNEIKRSEEDSRYY